MSTRHRQGIGISIISPSLAGTYTRCNLFGVMVHLVKRRAFYRRNEAGVEEFSSYSATIISFIYEKLLLLIAAAFAVPGVLLVAMHGFQLAFQ